MIPWLGAVFLVVGFLVMLKLFRLVAFSQKVVALSRESLATMGSVDLSEEEKERVIQHNAIRLFGYFLVLALGGAGALLFPLGVLWVAAKLQLLELSPILAVTASPAFLIGTTVLAVAVLYFQHRGRSGEHSESNSRSSYSRTERLLHDVAFGTYPVQIALGGVEDRLFRKALSRYLAARPLFITGLPRAGTTLLLECCNASPEFAAHHYRDMPFVPLPCLWGCFTGLFGKHIEERERAHGDGMMINADSPEAFEEVLWMQFWPRQYRSDRILPWPADAPNARFRDFFASHMRKIIYRRRGEPAARYAAKNNLNIARVEWLRATYPDAVLLVPFRDPVQHAASLLRQHQNFLAIHSEDRFVANYMRAIGHFDFGANLRPVDFDGWLAEHRCKDRETLGFWLEYWTATYRHLLARDCGLRFFAYEYFCAAGEQGLRDLATAIDACQPDELQQLRDRLRPPQPRHVNTGEVPCAVLAAARDVYAELLSRACNGMPVGCDGPA